MEKDHQENNEGLLEKLEFFLAALKKHKVDIIRALEYGGSERDFDVLVSQVVRGTVHLYPLPNSVMIAEVVEGTRNVYHIWLAAGDLNELLSMMDFVKEQARANNCECIALSGRRGWVKVLEKYGYSEKHVYMEANI